MKYYLLTLSLFLSSALAIDNQTTSSPPTTQAKTTAPPQSSTVTVSGQKLLTIAEQMINHKEIIVGGCWDYVNTVYQRAGFPDNQRQTVFKGNQSDGPYADIDIIQSGDWLYFINHSYHDIEHSSMFIRWIDKSQRQGLMLSYGGEGRQQPARYHVYDLSHVYQIIRPKQ